MLLVTGMVLARLSLRSGWAMTLATLALVVLAVAKNGFRIFTLTMLALHVDPAFLHGQLHHNGGVVFFLLALVCFVALLWFLVQLERKNASRQSFGNTAPVVAAILSREPPVLWGKLTDSNFKLVSVMYGLLRVATGHLVNTILGSAKASPTSNS